MRQSPSGVVWADGSGFEAMEGHGILRNVARLLMGASCLLALSAVDLAQAQHLPGQYNPPPINPMPRPQPAPAPAPAPARQNQPPPANSSQTTPQGSSSPQAESVPPHANNQDGTQAAPVDNSGGQRDAGQSPQQQDPNRPPRQEDGQRPPPDKRADGQAGDPNRPPPGAPGGPPPRHSARDFIITGDSPAALAAAKALGLVVEQRALGNLGLVVTRVKAATADDADAALTQLLNDPATASSVSEDSYYRPQAAADSASIEQSCADRACGYVALKSRAQGWPDCAPRRLIGVIDTGVKRLHPGLKIVPILYKEEASAHGATPAFDGHGTAVAALIAGSRSTPFAGIAADRPLFAANPFEISAEGDVRASVFDFAVSLDWLAGAKIELLNLSLAGPRNPLIELALQRLSERGVIIFAAAGNDGPAAPPSYPAAYPSVIAVTAIDDDGHPYQRANRGDYIAFAAPGVDIDTASDDGGPVKRSGTSFSTALMTGLVAAAAPPGVRDRESAIDWLRAHVVDLGAQGRDSVFGWGAPVIEQPCR
jgi:hypothetical protein